MKSETMFYSVFLSFLFPEVAAAEVIRMLVVLVKVLVAAVVMFMVVVMATSCSNTDCCGDVGRVVKAVV